MAASNSGDSGSSMMGGIGMGVSIGGAIGSAIGSIFEGQAQRGWYKLNAALAESQARISAYGAKLNIKKFRQQSDSFLSTNVAAYAKAGVKFEGSPASVYFKNAKNLEYDALIQEYNADMGTWNASMQASIYQGYGSVAARAGVAKGVNTAVQGVGNTLMTYYGGR